MSEVSNGASVYDLYETVADAESTGAWIDIGPARFKLARTGGANENFMKTASKRLKPFQAALENLPKKAADELAIGIFIDTILMDWDGVKGRDGVVIPFSKEAAKALLKDLPNLLTALQQEANKMSNFTQANLEAAAKN
jgi:hypothetical protein